MHKMFYRLRLRFSRFQAKLILAFLLCTLVPLIIIGCISYKVSYLIAEDKIIISTLLSDDQINLQINGRLKQAERVADSIQYDMYTLTRSSSGDIMENLDTLGKVRSNLSLFKSTFDFLYIVVFLPFEQLGANEGLFFCPLEDLQDFYIPDKSGQSTSISSAWFYDASVKIPFILSNTHEPVPGIVCFRLLQNQGTNATEYAYLILLDPTEFSEILMNVFDNTAISSYFISDSGQIVAHNDGPAIAETLDEDKWEFLKMHPDSFVREKDCNYHIVILDNGWYHVTEIPESYIRNNTSILLNTILLTLLISLPITVFVILMISQSLTKRITALSIAMENFQLQETAKPILPRPKHQHRYDEIDKLGITFEKMQGALQENMKTMLELSLTEEKLKYKLLQSQINPHFLYNILGSIQSCQSIGKLDVANQMITDLTSFYRLVLRKSKDMILIRDELEIARLYLEMEKLCHNDNLTWEIMAEDGIQNFLICKFTLQPFLENSVIHGISRRTPHIHILLSVCYKDDTVLITINDNGIGMTDRQLQNLRSTLVLQKLDYEKHYGIGNVNQRIKSPSFGNGSIQIDSRLHEGTTITIEFEQMEDTDEESNDC